MYPPWVLGARASLCKALTTEVALDSAGGSVIQRWQNARSRAITLRARFKLSAGAQPGLYAVAAAALCTAALKFAGLVGDRHDDRVGIGACRNVLARGYASIDRRGAGLGRIARRQ